MSMTKENDDPWHSKRLQQLMAEVDGSGIARKRTGVNVADRQAASLLLLLIRWTVFGLLCLGLGFWVGAQNAELRWASRQPSEKQMLTAQGWRNDGSGVFYRWCQDACHAPRMYGGGVIKAFEVKCIDRPCGDISMQFNVLNSKGQVIDQIHLKENGLQGETRRFFVESGRLDASSFELAEFLARAKV
jgi:hypothetical protein